MGNIAHSAQPATASSSTLSLLRGFGGGLGYVRDVVHLSKELEGTLMRRVVGEGGWNLAAVQAL